MKSLSKILNHQSPVKMCTLKERYIAAMVLSGVGDAMGFKNGNWEFCHSGKEIHSEAQKLGGIEKLKIKKPKWIVSDDTILHLATAEAYMETKDVNEKDELYKVIAVKYKEGMHDMSERSPGPTTMNSCHQLRPHREKGYQIAFDPRGGGCGAAMRSMCIGLRYPQPDDLSDLIADSIESGRMTHHHPTGYLGSLAGALFTSYAIQEKPVKEWGACLMETLHLAKDYIKGSNHEVNNNLKAWYYFENAWKDYLEKRNLTSGKSNPSFPSDYDVENRDKFYKSLSYSGWGGASGHDAPMIAYDALLGAGESWIEVCKRGILHSGDNDSTGVMVGCWFGARYGFLGVPDNHHEKLEYRARLEKAAKKLYKLSQTVASDCAPVASSIDKGQSQNPDEATKPKFSNTEKENEASAKDNGKERGPVSNDVKTQTALNVSQDTGTQTRTVLESTCSTAETQTDIVRSTTETQTSADNNTAGTQTSTTVNGTAETQTSTTVNGTAETQTSTTGSSTAETQTNTPSNNIETQTNKENLSHKVTSTV